MTTPWEVAREARKARGEPQQAQSIRRQPATADELPDAPFGVYYHLLSGPSSDIERRAKQMGATFSPDFRSINLGGENYKYDPSTWKATAASSVRPMAQIAGGGLGGIAGAVGGPVGVGLGSIAGGVTGVSAADAAMELVQPSGETMQGQGSQLLHDVAGETAGVGLGAMIPPAFVAAGRLAKKAGGAISQGVKNVMAPAAATTENAADYNRIIHKVFTKQSPATPTRASRSVPSDPAMRQTAEPYSNPNAGILAEINPDPQLAKDFAEIGADPIPGMLSRNVSYRQFEGGLRSSPASGLTRAEKEVVAKLGDEATSIINDAGGMTDLSALSASIRNRVAPIIDKASSAANKLYDQVDAAIPKNTLIEPTALTQYLKEQADAMGGVENLTSAQKNLWKMTMNPVKDEAGKVVDWAPKKITYALLDRERKEVGAAVGKHQGAYKDETSARLDELYSVFSRDQQGAAEGISEELGNTYSAAKAVVQKRKELEKKMMTLYGDKLQNSLVPQLSGAMTKMTKGDVSQFSKLVGAIPKSMRKEVVASSLHNLFTSGSKSQPVYGQGFVNAWENLNQNKMAKDMLLSNLPSSSRMRLERFYRMGKAVKYAGEFVNRSNNPANAILQNWDKQGGMLHKLYGLARNAVVSTASPGAASVMNVVDGGANKMTAKADALVSSPVFIKQVADFATGKDAGKMVGKAYNDWVSAQTPEIQSSIMKNGIFSYLFDEVQNRVEEAQ